jgi:aryl-alcohol dehydrogenase-like predicted oxidoreductase
VSAVTAARLWAADSPPLQGLGLMHLADQGWGDPDRDPAELVRIAVEAGVTVLDTAEMYGNEEVVGRAVAAHREDVLLCSKFGVYWGPSGRPDDWSVRADPATVRSAVEGSLRRLDVEVIDLYYLHHRSDDTPIEDTVEAMAGLVRQGKIRAVGLSNVTVDDIRRAHAVHPVHAVQEAWSLSRRGVEAMLPVLAELGITLVAHSPLDHGALHIGAAGPPADALREIASTYAVTPGQLALAWVHCRGRRAGQPVVPLPGTTRLSHLRANAAAARLDIADADLDRLDAATG